VGWHVNTKRHGVEVVMHGRIGTAELTEANDAAYAALPAQPPRFAVFDLTAVDVLDVPLAEMRGIAAADLAASERFPDLLTVIIAPAAVNFGVARQWQMLADQLASQVVSSREQAELALAEGGFAVTDLATD